MTEAFKKLTAEVKQQLVEHLQTKEMQEIVAQIRAAEDTGSFEVVISTADIDRQGESIDQNGWELDFYKQNPVVLWAHDYFSLPIGITEEITVQDGKLIARGKFAPENANPFAQQVRRLYDLKIVRATSVGFITKEVQGSTITKAELLEFSFVPVPANPFALSLRKAQALGFDTAMLSLKGIQFTEEEKSVVDFEETPKAPEDREWDAGQAESSIRKWASSDGSGEPDTIDWEKYRRGFAWYDSGNSEVFGAYKLPHHEVIDGELQVVWRGVAAAMAALMGSRGGVDIPNDEWDAVYSHLAKHYAQFDKEPPEKSVKSPQCRQDGETKDECMSRKIPEILRENPDMEQDQAVAIAANMCETACSEKAQKKDAEKIGAELAALQNEVDDAIIRHSRTIIEIIQTEQPQESSRGIKVGRVLSEKNRKLIKDAIKQMETSIAALEALLKATEPQGSEGEERADGRAPKQRSNSAGSEFAKQLDEWLNSPNRQTARQVLRILNIATSKALEEFNARRKQK